MLLDLTDEKSTLVQVMAWCRQATSHYLSQCWPRSLLPYGVTRPQWVNCTLPWPKWGSRTNNHSLERKHMNVYWRKVNISLDNDLAMEEVQAIILTDDDSDFQYICGFLGLRESTLWGWDKMDTILQTAFSNAFSIMKMYEFQLIFHWSLFLRVKLTVFQHWFR